MGVDCRRRWRRFIAPLDERTVAPDKRLVRLVFGHRGLPANGDIVAEISGYQVLRSSADHRRRALFCRGEDCFDRGKPRALVVKVVSGIEMEIPVSLRTRALVTDR